MMCAALHIRHQGRPCLQVEEFDGDKLMAGVYIPCMRKLIPTVTQQISSWFNVERAILNFANFLFGTTTRTVWVSASTECSTRQQT